MTSDKGRNSDGTFKEGSKFWEIRAKQGLGELFESADLLWAAACEFFEWCDENPFYESKAMVVSNGNNQGSSIEHAESPKKRPYTMGGLMIFLECSDSYLRNYKYEHKASKEQKHIDILKVIELIEKTVYEQKFAGAASGFFNANLISRDLGLADKKEHTGKDGESLAFNIVVKDKGMGEDINNLK